MYIMVSMARSFVEEHHRCDKNRNRLSQVNIYYIIMLFLNGEVGGGVEKSTRRIGLVDTMRKGSNWIITAKCLY